MVTSIKGWAKSNRWPVRLTLVAGLPPLVYVAIHAAFGMLPLNFGPADALTCLPIRFIVQTLLGVRIELGSTAHPPSYYFAQHAFLLLLNLFLWFASFLLVANTIRRLVRRSGEPRRRGRTWRS